MINKKKYTERVISKKKDVRVLFNGELANYNLLFHKIFKSTIKDGKKIKVFNSFCFLIKKLKLRGVKISLFFQTIFKRLNLYLDYKIQHLGSVKYKLPYISHDNKSFSKVATWVRKAIKNRKERSFNIRLFKEFCDIISNKGRTMYNKRDFYTNFFRGKPFVRFLRLYKPRTKYRFNYINNFEFRKKKKFNWRYYAQKNKKWNRN